MAGRTRAFDLRTVLPVAALAIVVLVIVIVQLCGTEDVDRQARTGALPTGTLGPTLTPGPTETPGPSSTPGPTATADPAFATETAVAAAGGEGRDATRVQDLQRLVLALGEYRSDEGEYPSTGGNIQTLCAFTDTDAGCALEAYFDELPIDPLGDPGAQGYWYASDGQAFTIYAQRETDLFPVCDEHPDHLASFDSLFCEQGP